MDDFATMNKAYLEFFLDYVPVGYHKFPYLLLKEGRLLTDFGYLRRERVWQ